jgi:tetratricopeptide (TPR) repeat protein
MTQPAWLTKWQAREALQNGQPEEAHRLLESLLSQGNRRAWALQGDVVRGYLERAERGLRQDQVEAAWSDLKRAESLAPGDFKVNELRDMLTRLGLAEIRACLECGKPLQAITSAAKLKDRPAHSPELAPLEEAAREWLRAQETADRGDFALARESLERVRKRFPGRSDALDRFDERLSEREALYRRAVERLKESLSKREWQESIESADAVLAVAPQQRDIQQSRTRAWQALQPAFAPASSRAGAMAQTEVRPSVAPKRFLLWIDGVGSYLVCLSNRVSFGQMMAESTVDVPLLADISRVHACLTRDEEQYLFESSKGATLNGKSTEKGVLANGDVLGLSPSCEFRFFVPMPGSSTARLETRSIQRLPFRVNGILLMSQMLVLGPDSTAHLRVPWSQPLYLLRDRDSLTLKWKGNLLNNGEKFEGTCPVRDYLGSIATDCFSLAIEPFPTSKG